MTSVFIIFILNSQQRLLESSGLIGDLTVWQDLARLDRVAETDLPRVKSDLLREKIDQRFERVFALAHTKTSESAGRRIIGIISISTDVCVLIAVRSDRMRTCPLEDRAAQGGICAGVEIDFTVETGEDAIGITAQSERALHRMALRMEIDRVFAAQFAFDGQAELPGSKSREMLDRYILLASETAADQLIFDDDPGRIPAEHDGAFFPRVVRALVRAIYLHAVLVRKSDRALRFEECMLRERCFKCLRHSKRRLRQGFLRVAPGNMAALT